MTKLILLNGPPRSGKDTVARHLQLVLDAAIRLDKFAMPIKRAFAGMIGSTCDYYGDVPYHEEHKEEVIPWLGVSYRQWQIDFSERLMKPQYGGNIFGRMLLDRVKAQSWADNPERQVCVVSDCGFQIEVDTLILEIPPQNVLTLRLIRPGFNFDGDSRGFIEGPNRLNILNNADLPRLYSRVLEAVYEVWGVRSR